MLKTLSVFALAAVVATCAMANNVIEGTMNWVSGTATATITPTSTAQTIVLKVGTTDVTYKNVMIIGAPTDTITSGSPVELLLAGSQPFTANMTVSTVVAFSAYVSDTGPARRAVPMSTTGVLTDSIAFPNYGNTNLTLFYPTCSLGSYNFYGGIEMLIGAPLTKYTVSLPGPSVASGISSVVYPAGLPMNSFDFSAQGESSMEVGGRSTSGTVYTSGQFAGSVANFTSTVLTIQNQYE